MVDQLVQGWPHTLFLDSTRLGHLCCPVCHDVQRDAVLAGIVWVAGGVVPKEGISSATVSEEELNTNLDPKSTMLRVRLPETLEK